MSVLSAFRASFTKFWALFLSYGLLVIMKIVTLILAKEYKFKSRSSKFPNMLIDLIL